jgi:hypothetical protein
MAGKGGFVHHCSAMNLEQLVRSAIVFSIVLIAVALGVAPVPLGA